MTRTHKAAITFLALPRLRQAFRRAPRRRDEIASFPRRKVRSLFVSDLHLGSSGARAREFLRFLRATEAETIYLVGDIFDIWHVAAIRWSAAHDAILAELARRADAGVRVVYLPGNHDAAMRNFVQISGRMLMSTRFELADRVTHLAADGRRYLVLHGDQCDSRLLQMLWLTRLGSRMDARLRRVEKWLGTHFGAQSGAQSPLSLLRDGVNAALLLGNDFENRLVGLARSQGHDGVICGHFHRAASRDHAGIRYINCGDWVDSLTAVVERADGTLELVGCRALPAPRPAQMECAA